MWGENTGTNKLYMVWKANIDNRQYWLAPQLRPQTPECMNTLQDTEKSEYFFGKRQNVLHFYCVLGWLFNGETQNRFSLENTMKSHHFEGPENHFLITVGTQKVALCISDSSLFCLGAQTLNFWVIPFENSNVFGGPEMHFWRYPKLNTCQTLLHRNLNYFLCAKTLCL